MNLRFACVGLAVRNGLIVQAPPIFHKWVGKEVDKFFRYYRANLIERRIL